MQRNTTVDILRVIGLFLVIAAHCAFSKGFLYFRNFDVPLLVFASAISFTYSKFPDTRDGYLKYILHRFHRLVMPVWGFLILFFLFSFLIGKRYDMVVILKSFLLLSGGILFIWVYRIMFTTSLLNPINKRIADQNKPLIVFALSLAVLCMNDALHLNVFLPLGTKGKILSYILTYTVGYGILALLSMMFFQAGKKFRWIMILVFSGIYLGSGAYLGFPNLYDWKYPPMLYYLSYGIMMSGTLYLIFERVELAGFWRTCVTWLSRNCMNIFIWQIPVYYLLGDYAHIESAFLNFLILLISGILFSMLQEKVKLIFSERKQS